jgi:hypothetical protein
VNCLFLGRKKPARGKTKRADSTMITWTKEWNEKGQSPSMGESRSGLLEMQYVEHMVIPGMPDTRMPMATSRTRCFLVRLIFGNPLFRQGYKTA